MWRDRWKEDRDAKPEIVRGEEKHYREKEQGGTQRAIGVRSEKGMSVRQGR